VPWACHYSFVVFILVVNFFFLSGLVGFWRRIQEIAKLQLTNVVDLSPYRIFAGRLELGSSFFIRQCYGDIFDLASQRFQTHVEQPSSSINRVSIFGTPGIGKSTFLCYFLLRELAKGIKTVFLLSIRSLSGNFTILRFEVGSDTIEISDDYALFQADLDSTETLLLIDTAPLPDISCCDTLIVASAGSSKIYQKFDMVGFFMPVWTLEELSECRRAIYPKVTQDILDHQFSLWGGSARFTLHFPSINVLEKCDLSSLKLKASELQISDVLVPAKKLNQTNATNQVHSILHIDVDSNFQCSGIALCSDVAFRLLTEHFIFIKFEKSKFLEFFVNISSNPGLRNISALLYQLFVFRTLGKGGNFEIRSLTDVDRTETITLDSVCSLFFDSLQDQCVSEIASTSCRLLIPRTSIFPSVDALTKSGLLFQVTVSNTHPILAPPVRKILNTLQLSHQNAKLIFVHPTGTFKSQIWNQGKGVRSSKVSDLPEQYFLQLSTSTIVDLEAE
jgi:hypothetical protein